MQLTVVVRFLSDNRKTSLMQKTLVGIAALLAFGNTAALKSEDSTLKRARYEQYALTHQGDLERGKKLFLEHPTLKCSVCHRASQLHSATEGGAVGPDLSSIGGKFDRPHLIESILAPSSLIVEGYRTSLITTRDEESLTGVIRKESETEIELHQADGKVVKLNPKTIETRKESSVSIMPEGLENSVSESDFVDLISFLETLKGTGKASPGSLTSGPIKVPQGYRVRSIATGLSGSTAIDVLPDGRVLVCEQQGQLRMVEGDKLLPTPVLTLPVDSTWERGIIGVVADPDFAKNQFIYVCWVAKEPYPHHRISRFTLDGNVAAPGSEKLLLEGDDQTKMGGNVPAGHQGGAMHFGTDRKLYIALGEQTAGMPSQKLDTLIGKILRISSDGSIPQDNPLVSQTSGKYQAIYAYGLRNPFTFAIRKADGLMFANDVGGKFEEVNQILPGANYGWPTEQGGPTEAEGITSPIHWYPEASIAGGDFIPTHPDWPQQWQGQYIFADFVHGWIHRIDPAKPESFETFATGLQRPVDLRFAPSGALYVLLRNAWVIDQRFVGGTGTLLKIEK
jgi:putative heme-binding domain-containing protein